MKKQILIFLFLLSFAFDVAAQLEEPRKVDEFESIQCEDLRTRLDSFLVEIQNNPQSKGFVIVYEGKYSSYIYNRSGISKRKYHLPTFGEANYRTQVFLKHFQFRQFQSDKYLFIDGGFRENHSVELWIVPDTAKPPKPTPTLSNIKYRKGKPILIVCDE